MPMSDNAINDFMPTYFQLVDGKPTLWDEPGEGRIPAICIQGSDGNFEIHTDPDVVSQFI